MIQRGTHSLRSSSWGINQDARNAIKPIGAAIMNTVWMDSA